ncbi:MAG: V-type ATP synthase subunit D [Actinomycetia bacterium]|nr:V-type ATP synthase subunit D [Actinomycetes bacterium]
MEELHTTRTELLQRRTQIELAQQGRDLLEKKRDALLVEFMKIMEAVLELGANLRRVAADAHYALAIAQAVDGVVNLQSAALATRGEITVDISGTHIMGVPIPEVAKRNVRRSASERGYGIIGISSRVDEVAEKFEDELNIIIEMAAIETKLKRLGAEIQKTRRRVNALDQVVIPTLTKQVRYISMALDERSREDLFRLKRVKKTLEKNKVTA